MFVSDQYIMFRDGYACARLPALGTLVQEGAVNYLKSFHSIRPNRITSCWFSTLTLSLLLFSITSNNARTVARATTSASCAQASFSIPPLILPKKDAMLLPMNSPGRLSSLVPTSKPGFSIITCSKPICLTASSSSPFIFAYGILDVGEAPLVEMST